MKNPVYIHSKRWFQKTYGNTYFSCQVTFDDGSTETVTDFDYGYGDHYLTVAIEWLQANGYIPKVIDRTFSPTLYLRETLKCGYSVVDVQRKKDL